ncbi:apolipoprotein N-acyltransferase [Enterovibrio makurazakiensis]
MAGSLFGYAFRFDSIGLCMALASFVFQFWLASYPDRFWQKLLSWFFFGLSYYIVSLLWISGYLSNEYGDAAWIHWGLWPFLIAILTVSFVIVPVVTYGLSRLSSIIAFPFALSGLDILREQSTFSFPWLHPGYLFSDIGFQGLLSTFGSIGLSFVVYAFSSSLVAIYICKNKVAPTLFSLAFVTVALISNYSLKIHDSDQADTSEYITVRLIHGSFNDKSKLSKNAVIERVERYAALSLQAPKASLVIWPESTMSMPFREIMPFVDDSFSALNAKGVVVIWGGQDRQHGQIRNVVLRSDEATPIYYKQRLVPFGEYRPSWFGNSIHSVALSRGKDVAVSKNTKNQHVFGSLRAAVAVCYEALYSDVFSSKLKQTNTNAVVLLSDVEWTNQLWLKRILFSVAKTRAMEVGKPLLNVTNVGTTALISPDGKVIDIVEQLQRTQMLDVKVKLQPQQTFYTQHGHAWLLLLSIAVLFFLQIYKHINSVDFPFYKRHKKSQG